MARKVVVGEAFRDECRTKYPILLVHGTGFRDGGPLGYWGGIPRALEERGASVSYSGHDAWANVGDAAAQIVAGLGRALAEHGAEKVNVIAHSKGGIDVRYAAARLGIADRLASLTMVGSPNRGSRTVDALYSAFGEGFFRFLAVFVDSWFRILGDERPDFFGTTGGFRASRMERFNAEVSDPPSVPVQSFAGRMRGPLGDVFLGLLNAVVGIRDGENDGLVSVESARWGNFRGVLDGMGIAGISHTHEIDGYRTNPRLRPCEGLPPGSDTVRGFYVALVRELKERGL